MHEQIEEGEIINYHSNSSGLPKTQLRTPERPNSSCSSSLQSLSESEGNIPENKSSFKKCKAQNTDVDELPNHVAFYCPSFNLLGQCLNIDCTMKHIKLTLQNGLQEFINQNIHLIHQYVEQSLKIQLPPQLYQNQLRNYQLKAQTKQNIKNQELMHHLENKNTYIKCNLPNVFSPPTNGTYSLQSMSPNSHKILKPQPQHNFSQLIASPDPIDAFKKDLYNKLKTDIDKMQDKLRTVKYLKKWVQSQQVDDNEFYDIYYQLTPVQRTHFMKFFSLLDLQQPTISYCEDKRNNNQSRILNKFQQSLIQNTL